MKKNPLVMLEGFGRSIWLDYRGRSMLDSGASGRLTLEEETR